MTDLEKLLEILNRSCATKFSVTNVIGINEEEEEEETKILTIDDGCGCSVDLFFDINDNIV